MNQPLSALSDHARAALALPRFPPRLKLALMAAALPPLMMVLYLWLSTPAAEAPEQPVATASTTQANLELTLADLAARAEQDPGNARAWTVLARAYRLVGRLPEAAQAFARLGPALERSPGLLVEYADVLRALAGGQLEGRPLQLVKQALALDPQHVAALSLYATAALQRQDRPLAFSTWKRALALAPPGSEDAKWLTQVLADARLAEGPTRL